MLKAGSRALVVDIQFMQTGAFDRGMGRLFYGLFSALLEQSKALPITCLYSSNLPTENIHKLQEELLQASNSKQVTFLGLDLHIHHFDKDNYDQAYEYNSKVCEDFVANNFGQELVSWLVPSLMQEPAVPVLPDLDTVTKLVIWHDLMPYLMYKHYFPEPQGAYPRSYLKRLNLLMRADHVFCNSTQTKNDLIRFLSVPESRTTVIDGAINRTLLDDAAAKPPTSVKKPFFICPASPEPNKNVLSAIIGFGKFNAQHDDKYQLVITSTYDEKTAALAKKHAKNVFFSGHIHTKELRALYENTEGLLFVSKYEGLGMPILEAVAFGKKVICSDVPVFREISSTDAFYWCDPLDTDGIARELNNSIRSKTLSSDQKQVYKQINEHYTWARSATLLLDGITSIKPRKTELETIAVVGPHPASFSSIGKAIAEAYPYMSEKYTVHYYYDSGPSDQRHGLVRFHYLQQYTHLFPVEKLLKNKDAYKKIIYHMGNSDHHMKSYMIAKDVPDTMILHDTDLSGDGLAGQMLSNGFLSPERLALENRLESRYLNKPERFITSLVSSQPRVITHSTFAYEVVREYSLAGTDKRFVRANHPMHSLDVKKVISDKPIKLGIAGIVSNVKGINTIEWLIEQTDGLRGLELYIFGFSFFADKRRLIELSQVNSNVKVVFDLTDFEFNNLLASMDILINYRAIYKGEASRATLESLREGVVPVVRNIGWFSELPDDVCFKLEEIEELPKTLRALGDNPRAAREKLRPMIASGQSLLTDQFSFEEYVDDVLGK